ncbi:hypothetical protein EOM27_00715 [Candidatus Saccharibacteria bacterium]|jgi:hypothetical protein|nr:hypothetical protein [Candidatus Saccharibacteria bacterium]NCU43468.1 hypothetical protein [Candidatus Saccharibacteria bacterium]
MKILNKILIIGMILVGFSSFLVISSPIIVNAAGSCEQDATFLGIPTWYRGLIDSDCEIKKISEKDTDGISLSTFIWTIVLNLADGLFRIAGVIATGFIVWAGFQYMISQGNSSKVAASKTTLVNAIIGLVIASLSVALTNFVVNLIAS